MRDQVDGHARVGAADSLDAGRPTPCDGAPVQSKTTPMRMRGALRGISIRMRASASGHEEYETTPSHASCRPPQCQRATAGDAL
jgi:hypothetical protein